MFPSFGTREALIPAAKMFLLLGRNMFCFRKQCFSVLKNWETFGETCVRSKCFWQHVPSFSQSLRTKAMQRTNQNSNSTCSRCEAREMCARGPRLILFLLLIGRGVCAIFLSQSLEQFSTECRKSKTKVITLANHKGCRAIHCPMKTRSNNTKRGKTCAGRSRLVLVLLLIGRESDANLFSQSLSVANQNRLLWHF